MLKIGLTGGIGCGKSTVSSLFKKFGVPIIDADVIAHQVVEPGQPALNDIKKTFGTNLIDSNGRLDRAKLRDIVFADSDLKQKLENIIHPIVYQQINDTMEQLKQHYHYCIASVPLLLETHRQDLFDRVLVIDCPLETQKLRLKRRDQLSEDCIDRIITSQVSREVRLSRADDIIDNSKSTELLAEQVKKLHNQYLNQS